MTNFNSLPKETPLGAQSYHYIYNSVAPVSFCELARLWLLDIRVSVKESTYTRYHRTVEKYIVGAIGELEPCQIDRFLINSFSEYLLECGGLRGGGLSAKSVSDVICVVKAIIKFGQSNGYVFGNTLGIRLPQLRRPRVRTLEGDARAFLERVLLGADDPGAIGILLSLFTGIRIGEVCGLRWEDVDPLARTVKISRTVERIANLDGCGASRTKLIICEPKTERSLRVIPLPSFLFEKIEPLRRAPQIYIATAEPTPTEPCALYRKYKSLLRSAGLEDYSFHALRHTFATRCVEQGFDPKSLSEILGHSNISTTLALYVHPTLEQKRAQMERLAPQ